MDSSFYQARVKKIRERRQVSVVLRRGDDTLNAQNMRIEYAGARGFRLQSDAARQAAQAVFILGEPDMDIAVDDRLTVENVLYQVVFVQPNRLAATIAEAIVIR